MKKAFTLVELVLVIVIVGIISAVMVPRLNRSTLDEAAHQIVTHIRYTQHLALMDDKYDPNDATWYKTRWQLFFSQGSNHQWAYTVFSDFKGTHTGNPDAPEIAKNPIDTKKYLTGGLSSSGLIHYDDQRATKELNLADKYGVTNVQFTGCGSTARRIAFDHVGRPIIGNSRTMNKIYSKDNTIRILQNQCKIVLTDKSGKTITIAIERETGYTHIL